VERCRGTAADYQCAQRASSDREEFGETLGAIVVSSLVGLKVDEESKPSYTFFFATEIAPL
jgi:hypothetical protein